MKPLKFLLEKLDTDIEGLEQHLYDAASGCELIDELVEWMEEYAELKSKRPSSGNLNPAELQEMAIASKRYKD